MPFKERPLIRIEEGSSPIPVSFAFMLQKLATGPYWLLHSPFAASHPERGVQNFKGVIGTLFEDYVQEALTRAFAPVSDALFVEEKAITGGGKGIKKPDGVLQQGSSLVVLESSATVLSDAVVERTTHNREVGGSNSAAATNSDRVLGRVSWPPDSPSW